MSVRIDELRNQILLGDSLDVLKTFPDDCIDCVITSPPYWQQRNYKVDNQLGQEKTFHEYIDKLIAIFTEVKRVIKPTGNVWVNLGDKILDQNYQDIPERFSIAMKDRLNWIKTDDVIWEKSNATPGSAKNRYRTDYENLFRFVKTLKFYFRIQYKPLSDTTLKEIQKEYNGMATKDYKGNNVQDPSNMKRNIIKSIRFGGNNFKEYGNPVYSGKEWNPDTSNRIVLTEGDKKRAMSLGWDGITDYAYWYFVLREKKSWHNHKNDDTMGMLQRKHGTYSNLAYPYGSAKGSVWRIPHATNTGGTHFAKFTPKLVDECIKSSCPENICANCNTPLPLPRIKMKLKVKCCDNYDENNTLKPILLDPFVGDGTAVLKAVEYNLDFIGIDISQEYVDSTNRQLEQQKFKQFITNVFS